MKWIMKWNDNFYPKRRKQIVKQKTGFEMIKSKEQWNEWANVSNEKKKKKKLFHQTEIASGRKPPPRLMIIQ